MIVIVVNNNNNITIKEVSFKKMLNISDVKCLKIRTNIIRIQKTKKILSTTVD